MKLLLTYDYELFFGNPCGTAEKSILEPTELLRDIARRTGVKMVFFIDTGYLKKLDEFAPQFERVAKEKELIQSQITNLISEGHECQLHIHPHWEDSLHDGKNWVMKTDRYKLTDFSDEDIERIVLEYQAILHEWTKRPVNIFRAGGWCLQPFDRIYPAFQKAGLKIDSSVFPGGKFTAGNYYYDFTTVPPKSSWKFNRDLCVEDSSGIFKEYPIGSYYYSPLFFWKLFALGRLQPAEHKPLGDGYPMASPGLRKEMLTRGKLLSASCDGYFVTKLPAVVKKHRQSGFEHLVILGHPKACTRFALRKLEAFIEAAKKDHQFLTFTDLLDHETD